MNINDLHFNIQSTIFNYIKNLAEKFGRTEEKVYLCTRFMP